MTVTVLWIARGLLLSSALVALDAACSQPILNHDLTDSFDEVASLSQSDADDARRSAPRGPGSQPPAQSAAGSDAPDTDRGRPPELERLAALIEERRWRDAVAAADTAIADGAGGAEVFLLKGRAHDALDESDDAETAWLEAFRRDRASPDALFLLAESAERRGQRYRCEQLYRRILDEVDARFVPAREKLVRLYADGGRLDKAADCFAGFARQKQTGPAVNRCQALLNFHANRSLEKYQAELRQIIDHYPSDARTYVDFAKTLSVARAYGEALVEVNKALEIAPADLPARELKAALEEKRLRFDAAAASYDDLLRDRPNSAQYQLNLVDLALDQADFDVAATRLRRVLARRDLGANRAPLEGRLVEVLKVARRYDEAVVVAKAWLDDSPDDPLRRASYLAALSKAGRHDEAVVAAGRYLAEDPTNAGLRVQFIAQLSAAERYVEAQQRVLAWLEDNPDDIQLNARLIQLCWQAGQWDSAIELAQAGTGVAEHQGPYEDLLSQSWVLAKRFDEVVAFYRKRLKRFESIGRQVEGRREDGLRQSSFYYEAVKKAYRDLIGTLILAERFAEAEQVTNNLLLPRLRRRDAGGAYIDAAWVGVLRRYLATIYQLTNRPLQAAQQLEEIYKLDPTDVGNHNDLGYTWADAGLNLDRAERMIRFAVGEQPRQSAYLDSLGWVLYKRGRFDEAVHYLELAIRQTESAGAVIHDHLGDALYRVGRSDEAGKNWEKALESSRPDADPAPTTEERRLHAVIQAKLGQLAGGEVVRTAPVADPAATQPAG